MNKLKTARRLKTLELEIELEPPTVRNVNYWLITQTVVVVMLFGAGALMTLSALFGEAYAEAGLPTPTPILTPLPTIVTRTPVPTSTPTATLIPPQGKGKSMAEIFTSAYEGFDNRFGTSLMGIEPDYEEYLLCFDGTGRTRNGSEGVWGIDPYCMPGTFYFVSKTSNILITSDVLHAIGLTEVDWTGISVHIYANGAPEGYAVICPAGVVADTSKFCLGSQ